MLVDDVTKATAVLRAVVARLGGGAGGVGGSGGLGGAGVSGVSDGGSGGLGGGDSLGEGLSGAEAARLAAGFSEAAKLARPAPGRVLAVSPRPGTSSAAAIVMPPAGWRRFVASRAVQLVRCSPRPGASKDCRRCGKRSSRATLRRGGDRGRQGGAAEPGLDRQLGELSCSGSLSESGAAADRAEAAARSREQDEAVMRASTGAPLADLARRRGSFKGASHSRPRTGPCSSQESSTRRTTSSTSHAELVSANHARPTSPMRPLLWSVGRRAPALEVLLARCSMREVARPPTPAVSTWRPRRSQRRPSGLVATGATPGTGVHGATPRSGVSGAAVRSCRCRSQSEAPAPHRDHLFRRRHRGTAAGSSRRGEECVVDGGGHVPFSVIESYQTAPASASSSSGPVMSSRLSRAPATSLRSCARR